MCGFVRVRILCRFNIASRHQPMTATERNVVPYAVECNAGTVGACLANASTEMCSIASERKKKV